MKKTTCFLCLFIIIVSNSLFSQSVAVYDIVFESVWESVDDNPTDGISTTDLPRNAHWSPLALVTHKTENTFLMMGGQASAGIESIAETGNTSIFENEVNANTNANQVIIGNGLSSAKGTISITNVEVSEEFPFVTLASMIAPSPDWFIAVNSENLRSDNNNINNGWKSTYTIDLYPYDAGTEDGNMYSLSNPDTNPMDVISSLSNITPFNDKKIGTVTFIYNSSSLSAVDYRTLKDLKVYPNPAQDYLTISNTKNTNLTSVEIFNVLGKLVKRIKIPPKNDHHNININTLTKGIYMINLTGSGSETYIQKLIKN